MAEYHIRTCLILLCNVLLVLSKPLHRRPIKSGGPIEIKEQNQVFNQQVDNIGIQENIPGQNGLEVMRPIGKSAELAAKAEKQFQNIDLQPLGKFPQQNQANFIRKDNNVVHQQQVAPGGYVQQKVDQGVPNNKQAQPGNQQNVQQLLPAQGNAQQNQNQQALPLQGNAPQPDPNRPNMVQNMPNLQMGQRGMNFNAGNVQGKADNAANMGVLEDVGHRAIPKQDIHQEGNKEHPPQGAPQLQSNNKPVKGPAPRPNQQMQVAPPNEQDNHNQGAALEQVMQIAPAEQQQPQVDGAENGAGDDQQLQKPVHEDAPQDIPQAEPQPIHNIGPDQARRAEGIIPKPQREEESLHFQHKSRQRLKMRDLQPPDHLEGVRMEQDGHLNKDYRKEIFLGHGHESFEQIPEAEVKKKLKKIVTLADINNDGFISTTELEDWIILKVKEHFEEAAGENENVFKALDTDNDGFITWQEFQVQFLMARGMEQADAEKFQSEIENIPASRKDKELLVHYRFHWSDADANPSDEKLDLQEFQSFRHPESSSHTTGRMIKDIIENLDADKNNIITEEEFVALPPGEVVEEEWKEADRIWVEERRKEFRTYIDLNGDGKCDMEELKKYVDPQNPNHARVEARNLIQMADSDKDDKLSLSEVLDNMDLFLGSKMVDTARSFHDEF